LFVMLAGMVKNVMDTMTRMYIILLLMDLPKSGFKFPVPQNILI